MENKNVNISVTEGDAMFCHELSINYNPLQFVFDFKTVTPRVDPRSKEAVIHIKHNVVMLDPYHTKKMLELLSTVVADFEKDYGTITKPKSIEKMEKKMSEKGAVKSVSTPTYFG
jgi:hypothetical protein